MRAVFRLLTIVLLPLRILSAQSLAPALRDFVAVSDPVVALTHVRVVDGTGAPQAEDQTIVIAQGNIQSVGQASSAQVPAGAKVLELRNHTVIPGLVGLHDHSYYGAAGWISVFSPLSSPRLYLGSGVTTIRTT